tara:strand:- start:874 stop:1260 length:387 start_codon:yes stop_codon:yes gene_type:complete
LGISHEKIACRIIEKKKIVSTRSRIDNKDRENKSKTSGPLMQFILNNISPEKNSIINASIIDRMASFWGSDDFPIGEIKRLVIRPIVLLIWLYSLTQRDENTLMTRSNNTKSMSVVNKNRARSVIQNR